MPERRIDAIGKTAPSSWHATALAKSSPHLLRVISGQLSQMQAGEVMGAVVQKAAKGAFKIVLNGETFIIKGLPASLLGAEVNFVVRQTMSSGKPDIGLFWLGQGKEKNTAIQPAVQQPHSRVQMLSSLPAGLLTRMRGGNNVAGHIDHIQAGKMAVTISLPDPNNPAKNVRHQLQTTAASHLGQGQPIFVRLASDSNDTLLEILPRQQAGSAVASSASPRPQPVLEMASLPLATGDITAAVVQKRLSNGHIQLNIQGLTVETPAPVPVMPGDLLTLRMTTPPAEFQLISVQKNVAEKATAAVKNNLSASQEPLSQTLTAIRNLLPSLQHVDMPLTNAIGQMEAWFGADASAPISGKHLAALLHDSGGGLEAKLLHLAQQSGQQGGQQTAILQDLKSILLQLSASRNSALHQTDIIKTLSELGHHGAARIETTQALNALAHIQGDPIRFELPMLVGQQLVNVQMSMQQDHHTPEQQESDGSHQAISVLFALELSGLGNMRVDATVSERSVHARIYSDQTGVGQFIHQHIQRLQTRLQDLGYKEVFLLAAQTPPDAEKQRRFDQLATMAPVSLNLLDVIA